MTKTTTIDPKLVDQLLETYQQPEDLLGENGLLKQLTKALLERALNAEMTHHLGHAYSEFVTNDAGNKRNGTGSKTIKGEFGQPEIEVPETATPASSRASSRSTRRACAAWTRRSSRRTPNAEASLFVTILELNSKSVRDPQITLPALSRMCFLEVSSGPGDVEAVDRAVHRDDTRYHGLLMMNLLIASVAFCHAWVLPRHPGWPVR